MRRTPRLSRIQFIVTGGALLASCSGLSRSVPQSLPSGSDLPVTTMQVRRGRVTAQRMVGHPGYRISSSIEGHAVAVHLTTGEFVGSIAVGPELIRYTRQKPGAKRKYKTFLTLSARTKPGWHHIGNHTRFAQRTTKRGSIALFVRTPVKMHVVMYIQPSGFLSIRQQHTKSAIDVEWHSHADGLDTTTSQAALSSIVDAAGDWRGDDDFAGTFARQKKHRTTTHAAMAKSSRSGKAPSATQRGLQSIDSGDSVDVPADCLDCDPYDSDPYDSDLVDFGPGDSFGDVDMDSDRVQFESVARTVSGSRSENAVLDAPERAFLLSIGAAALIASPDLVPVALVLAKLSYKTLVK